MKRRIILVSSVIAFGLFTGCASNADDKETTTTKLVTVEMSTDTAEAITEVQSSDTENEAAEDVSEITTNEDTTEITLEESVDYDSIVPGLLGGLDVIDKLGGGGIAKDENDTVIKDDKTYAFVTDARFSSANDIREYIYGILTEECVSGRYSNIVDGDSPYYIDIDDKLYGYNTAKGCGFVWKLENDNPVYTISEETDSSFVVNASYDDYGAEAIIKLSIVKDSDTWKIDKIEF